MAWNEALTGRGFRSWLIAVAGNNARILQGQDLDPFTTSMRVLKKVAGWIKTIREGQNLNGGRTANQAITDMASAEFIQHEPHGPTLTGLGHAVFDKWKHYDIANAADEDEIPRCLVLIQIANELQSLQYLKMLGFWREIRDVFDPEELFANPEALYLLSYLNQSVSGYNPWLVIKAVNPEGVVQKAMNWELVKGEIPNSDEHLRNAVDNLARRVNDYKTRASGRINFCRAMELFILEPAAAQEKLDEWSLPIRTKEKCLEIIPTQRLSVFDIDPKTQRVFDLLNERHNVVLYGPPGTGKTYQALAIVGEWQRRYGPHTTYSVTFHPSYGYEDFVEGYRPAEDNPGNFVLQAGVFKKAAQRAKELKDDGASSFSNVLVFIDEINRGDVARIFGELITYIEPDKRNKPVYLSQSPSSVFQVPDNLYLLGTMNTADKSVSLIDVALRRRFAFVEFPPDPSFFSLRGSWHSEVDGLRLSDLLLKLNQNLYEEGIEIDRAIGHALLKIHSESASPVKTLKEIFEYDIVPLIAEYSYTDRERVKRILGPLVDEQGRSISLELPSDKDFLDVLKKFMNITNFEVVDEAHSAPQEEEEF